LVQSAATKAQSEKRHLREVVSNDKEFASVHSQLDQLFNETRMLQHVGRSVDAVAHLA
jgi:hypothetical protein